VKKTGAGLFGHARQIDQGSKAALRASITKAPWVELVEYADLAEEEKWAIFCLMLAREDAKLEEVPGLGLKVTLPPSRRH